MVIKQILKKRQYRGCSTDTVPFNTFRHLVNIVSFPSFPLIIKKNYPPKLYLFDYLKVVKKCS